MRNLKYNTRAYDALAAYLDGGRLPHAILLEGLKGSGRTTFAYEIAMGAICADDHAPCGTCKDCNKAQKRIHPDILEFGGDGGSRSFHVDKVREIRQEAYIRPNESPYKILILKDVHTMSVQAENALLKIIEEPPAGVIFILICENKASLLETILSRVTVIQMQTPSPDQCVEVLKERIPHLSDEQYRNAAIAGGTIGGAISLLERENENNGDKGLSLLNTLCFESELDALGAISKYEKNMPAFQELLESMAVSIRLLLSPHSEKENSKNRLRERLSPLQLMRILAIIEEIGESVPQNINRLLLVTNLCARIKTVVTR